MTVGVIHLLWTGSELDATPSLQQGISKALYISIQGSIVETCVLIKF